MREREETNQSLYTARCRAAFSPENIPEMLKEFPGWLVWRAVLRGSRMNKVPHYPSGGKRTGTQGSEADRRHLGTFRAALDTFQQDLSYAGIGLAMLEDWNLVGYDADKCVNDQGQIDADVRRATEGTYRELSPSGKGVRAFFIGQHTNTRSDKREVYATKQFVTVTGRALDETRTLRKLGEGELLVRPASQAALAPCAVPNPQLKDDLRSALEQLDADAYDSWIANLLALKTAPLPVEDREELAHWWSARSLKYDFNEVQEKFDSLLPERTSYKAIFAKAQCLGWINPASGLEILAGRSNSQDHIAEAFVTQYQGRLQYAHDMGCWLEYDQRLWTRDSTRKAYEYARQISRRFGTGKHTERAAFYSGVEQIAKCDPRIACSSADFDQETNALNTPAGVIDLRTGCVVRHEPSQRLSKITSVAPTREHNEVFLRAITEICGGNASLVRFHQVSLGAILSGAPEAHFLLYWFGTGRNGKNLIADLVFWILGDYAHKLPSSALMSKKYEAHPSELTGLRGVRLALSSEIEEGSFWNEARLKELTGDEFITARYMGRDAFTFRKSHKHLILGNHRPQVKTVDDAIKNRMILVPFDVSFAGREDMDLPRKIREEAGFVLQWLIDGHIAWLANDKHLPSCHAVEEATRGYFAAQSTIDMWIDERCRTVATDDRRPNEWPLASALYRDYHEWKRDRGELPVSQTRFGEIMSRSFSKTKTRRGLAYIGVQLDQETTSHWQSLRAV
jgi:putative DNA primase/helicase